MLDTCKNTILYEYNNTVWEVSYMNICIPSIWCTLHSASRNSCRSHTSHFSKRWSLSQSIFHLFWALPVWIYGSEDGSADWSVKDTLFLWMWRAAQPLGAASEAVRLPVLSQCKCLSNTTTSTAEFSFPFGLKWEITVVCCIEDIY